VLSVVQPACRPLLSFDTGEHERFRAAGVVMGMFTAFFQQERLVPDGDARGLGIRGAACSVEKLRQVCAGLTMTSTAAR
jgi:hypothetical protein